MGENEEKAEGTAEPQTTTTTEEPKETDSMLKKEEQQEDKPATEEIKKSKENLVDDTAALKKDEIINIPEEGDNKEEKKDEAAEKPKKEASEGREVKPKKIPIGGFKLPGFFTRAKKPAEESDGAEGELLAKTDADVEKGGEEEAAAAATEDTPANESRFNKNLLSWFKNPFAKKEAAPVEGDEEAVKKTEEGDEKKEGDEEKKTETASKEAEGEEKKVDEAKPVEESVPAAAEKKSVLSNIRLPHITLSNLIPRRLRPGNRASEDLEMGSNGPKTKAGLASMETLDDSLKDTDSKDQTDKAAVATNGKMADEDLETVKLEGEEKPKDKAAEAAEDEKKPKSIMDRMREYQCTVGE